MNITTNNEKIKLHQQHIPQELIELRQWVAWAGTENGNGKLGKTPINPETGRYAKANDPETWGTFEEALACCQENGLQGIGFVFSENDRYVGIDLDKCRDPETGEFESKAKEIIDLFKSYTEISPSGNGAHILLKGRLPAGGRKNEKVEIYDQSRFFTVTGNHVEGTPSTIYDRNEDIETFYRSVFEQSANNEELTKPQLGQDDELIEIAMNAENGEKFGRLWNGDYYGYPSQSEADLALCRMLAFYTDCDSRQIDRLFRQSGLYRSKWDRRHHGDGRTYGVATIQKAIEATTETYNPGQIQVVSDHTEQTFKLTDLGNAERLVAQHGRDIRYCHAWKKWLIWDGIHWAVDRTDAVKQKAKEAVRSIYGEAKKATDDSKRQAIAKHAMNSESDSRIRAMLSLAKSEPGIPILPEQLDQDPWLLTCLNGTIDLRTGKVQPHQRDHLITQLAPVEHNPDATCPKWYAFLDRIMDGNENLIAFLERAIGYSLTGDTSEQCLFILYGTGANGKSTFLQAVSSILGDYAKQTPTETLLVKQRGAIPNDVARLKGARLVTASEAEADQRLAESLIKQMTGSDTVSARFLHQEWFDFQPTHKIFLGTNHKPVIKGTDHAIWRRIRLVQFEVTIPEPERDLKLLDKLREELPGILAWAVRGCLEWGQNGLGEPDEVKDATQNYRNEMDILAQFFTDCCVENPSATVKTKDLYEAYSNWCENNGETASKKRAFGMRLQEKGFKSIRIGSTGARGWKGVGLLTQQA